MREELVTRLDAARRERRAMMLPSVEMPGLTLDDAYAVQRSWTARRIAHEGRRPVGYKVALTTRGQQRSFGSGRPVYGILLDDMEFGEGSVPFDRFVTPRLEMELAFHIGNELQGPCSDAEALAAIDWVAPAIEILDSRTIMADPATGRTRSAIDIVADGGGAAGYVLSAKHVGPAECDLSRLGAVLYHNGEPEGSGLFPLVFGRPERAVTWLASERAEQGCSIEAGAIILSGSVIKPYPVARGDRFAFNFGALGTIELEFD